LALNAFVIFVLSVVIPSAQAAGWQPLLRHMPLTLRPRARRA
jgi:hypothetical protein